MISNPTIKNDVLDLYRKASAGNREAYEFLIAFDKYFEHVHSISINPSTANGLIDLFAQTNLVYSLPFYARHGSELRLVIEKVFGGLADSVALKGGSEEWQRAWGATSDLGLSDVVVAVAAIAGGYSNSRSLSLRVKELLWASRDFVGEKG